MGTRALPSTSPFQESHVRVAPSNIAGNGLFANKDIPAGSSIVIAARPLLGELDLPRLQDTCANCFKGSNDGFTDMGEPVTLSACSGCKKVRYCSKACQKQAWKRNHKLECELLRDSELPPLPSSVRAALQLTAYMAGDKASKEDKEAVHRLESHNASTYTELDAIEQFKITVQAAKDVYERLSPGDPEASQIQEHVGRILRNSLTLTTPTLDPLGLAFDPLICTANHSCLPNAIVLFDSPRLLLRSILPISANSEIFISYIDTTNPYTRRQHELLTRYSFTCTCPKCTQGPTLREDNLHNPPTLNPEWLKRNLDILDPEGANTFDPANHVGDTLQEKALSGLQGRSYQLLDHAKSQPPPEAMKTLIRILRVLGDVDNDATHEPTWPVTRQPRISARLDLIPILLHQNEVGLALKHLAKLYFEIDMVVYKEQLWHPVRIVHIWTLVRTLLTAYHMPHDTHRPLDPEVRKLFEGGFDFMVVIWRALREATGLVEKGFGAGSVRDLITGLEMEIRREVGEAQLRALESDPLGVWGMFRKLGESVV